MIDTPTHIFEVWRRGLDGETVIERISAKYCINRDSHVILRNGNDTVLSIHRDHCISVRNISLAGEPPERAFDEPEPVEP